MIYSTSRGLRWRKLKYLQGRGYPHFLPSRMGRGAGWGHYNRAGRLCRSYICSSPQPCNKLDPKLKPGWARYSPGRTRNIQTWADADGKRVLDQPFHQLP